jgi:DNA-binding response OmpR family regulator
VRILLAEDRRIMADSLARSLRREGMAVDVVYDGQAALDLATVNDYQVMVLDRDLPMTHGDEVCQRLAGGDTRIIMLTAAGDVDERVEGLSLGADDYLPKPFDLAELVARIRALARRAATSIPPVLVLGNLTLDPHSRRVNRDGRTVELTNKEFGVLQALMSTNGGVLSAEELLERVWDIHADPFTNTVRVTIANLRRKLGDPPILETVIGAGYRMVAP